MQRYLTRLIPIPLSRARRKTPPERASHDEVHSYRSLAGVLMYLENGLLPKAAYITSLMQQKFPILRVQNLFDANSMLREILKLDPVFYFPKPNQKASISLCIFSDVSDPRDRGYGQTGILYGLRYHHNATYIYHTGDWFSIKQRRVSYSSFGSEILAASSADDCSYYYAMACNSILPPHGVQHELNIDSRALSDNITTLHKCREYRLRQTFQMLRNSFESGDVHVIRWIPGIEMLLTPPPREHPNYQTYLTIYVQLVC